jgi:hypothetical protein
MSTTTEAGAEQEARLARLGRRIDAVADKTRGLAIDVRATASRRVDDLRAQEAQARTHLRNASDTFEEERRADKSRIDAQLADIEHEVEITEAEVDAEMAADADAFVEAGERAAAAWDAYLDTLGTRADAADEAVAEQLHASVARARERRAEVGRRIERVRQASSENWATARGAVREALDDLDWASEQAADDIARTDYK